MSTKVSKLLEQTGSQHHELTSDYIKTLAGRGLHDPGVLNTKEIRELCGSVMAHIERRSEEPGSQRYKKM